MRIDTDTDRGGPILAYERMLVLFLRLFGGVTSFAIVAVLLPTDWMAATHAWLGLGAMPRAPLTEYLTRSIAGLYGIHGGAILLASADIRRFGPLVTYLAVADGLFGVALIAIDVFAGLPWYWTALEGPSVMVTGVIILALQWKIRGQENPSNSERARFTEA
jgi:hypothetical protein